MQKKLTEFGIREEEVADFFRKGRPKSVFANEILFRENQTCNSIVYIKKGVTRHFIITQNGKDITKNFTTEGNFVFYSISSFLTLKSSKIQFQAITECELLEWDRKLLENLIPEGNWLKFYNHLLENFAIKKEEKEISLLTEKALKKYEDFLRTKGRLLNLVPHYHIASYLGMSPETLSRVRHMIS
ncbi:MAG: Crp/Fnr family transcriptional regulator [Bacteroidota bacterium]